MRIKMILPALTDAVNRRLRPIKYAMFPPLGLATLAGHLEDTDEVELVDEHVERIRLDDEPDLVVLQVYITSARRAYALADHYRARGAYVVMGGLHVTSLPDEAAAHADTICLGPGEDTWPRFLKDFRAGHPAPLYRSKVRSLEGMPPVRRDLIKRDHYLVPDSLVVSRGCPHHCGFCYKDAFYDGGKSFYTQRVDAALAEIDSLPGRHIYFLDDNLFGNPAFAASLFDGLKSMGKVWQAAGTVKATQNKALLELAAESGLRSLFIGLETLNQANLNGQGKEHNSVPGYERSIRRLHDLGIMVNGSFVFGMDHDRNEVFDRTVEWAVAQGIETATFHILTPYPGTPLHARMSEEGRILHEDWDRYDTRHAVFRPAQLSPEALEAGYWRAYKEFYSFRNI
ncbi:MAG: cobalamin-dependent protein, partial [FCB group bacterium]|nr:cobalamin-dependent protein [FCB group bacterium]